MTHDPDIEDDEEDGSGRSGRLSDVEFAEARDLYETGVEGLVAIARRFNVSRQALSQRFKNNGVVRNSRKPDPAKLAAQIAATPKPIRFVDQQGEWIEEARMQGHGLLKQVRAMGAKMVADKIRSGGTIGELDDDLKALQRFNKIIVDNLAADLVLLDAQNHVDDVDLPTLRIEDLTDDDILNHFKSTGVLDEEATVADMLAERAEAEKG